MSAANAHSLSELLRTWSQALEADPAKWRRFQGRYRFIIRDDREQNFDIVCADSSCRLEKSAAMADCEMSLTAEELIGMAKGELNPQVLYLEGKLKTKGELAELIRWNVLFEELSLL